MFNILSYSHDYWKLFCELGVRSKFLGGGEGVVDGEGGSSEGCLKWGGGGH